MTFGLCLSNTDEKKAPKMLIYELWPSKVKICRFFRLDLFFIYFRVYLFQRRSKTCYLEKLHIIALYMFALNF